MAEAISQPESASGFDWDIALDLGDMSGEVGVPKDPEGEEIVRQFGVLKKHRREQIYDLSGASGRVDAMQNYGLGFAQCGHAILPPFRWASAGGVRQSRAVRGW